MVVNMEPTDWNKIKEGLCCKQVGLPVDSLDSQSSFALAYHSVASIRARCYKNAGKVALEPPSYSAEAILSTRSSGGQQLAVRLLAAPEGRLEITVCSGGSEESLSSLTSYEEKYRALLDRIAKMDEKDRNRVVKTIEVEMELDAALHKILVKAPVGEIYPAIGIVREVLIKTLEGFDPIHIDTGEVMASLCGLPQDMPLDPEKSRTIAIRILDWKMRLSRKIDQVRHVPSQAQEPNKQS